MTRLVDHSKPITPQEILNALCDMYAAFYFVAEKSNVQFDAVDQANIVMGRARDAGLVVTCNATNPEPPKIDLPLFNFLDV